MKLKTLTLALTGTILIASASAAMAATPQNALVSMVTTNSTTETFSTEVDGGSKISSYNVPTKGTPGTSTVDLAAVGSTTGCTNHTCTAKITDSSGKEVATGSMASSGFGGGTVDITVKNIPNSGYNFAVTQAECKAPGGQCKVTITKTSSK